MSASRARRDAVPVIRFALAGLLWLTACSPMQVEKPSAEGGYTGTVQKVLRVVRRGSDVPGIGLLGSAGRVLGSALRRNAETHQYVVRTPKGQVIAQSDEEFPVGECVEVIPEASRPGPAFRYGEATVVRSESCTL
jgi:hypothetical protein